LFYASNGCQAIKQCHTQIALQYKTVMVAYQPHRRHTQQIIIHNRVFHKRLS